jgi:lipopolysaccharide/colanic/teichoic acid biosynthesis glycosyltransferase
VYTENIEEILLPIHLGIRKKVYLCIKRLFDILFSVLGLIILSPLFLLIMLVIKLDSKGPCFFVHKRVGKKGKTIGVYKFRTMVDNAEEMLKHLTAEQEKEFKENFKMENDFRITKVGNILRKTSLDELPQLLNILKGDMSFIGPRPVIEMELEKYDKYQNKFLSVTPGLTGYWQANGRSDTTYEERVNMDMYYIDHMNIFLDIKIIFQTIRAVIKKEGAK